MGTEPKHQKKQPAIPVWTWRDAIRQADIAPLTKLVCYTIANHLSDAGKGYAIDVGSIIAESGLSNRSVATHIQLASDAGLLHVERQKDDSGRYRWSHYRPRFPSECELAREPADMRVEHSEADQDEFEQPQVKEVHAVEKPREGASHGEPVHVNLVQPPREPGALVHVNLLHVSKEDSQKNLSNNLSNSLPQTPAPRKARGGEIDQILELVSSFAADVRVVDRLLGPLARQRKIEAPDVGYALGALAGRPSLARLDDEGLDRLLAALLAERQFSVKPSDVERHERQEQPRFEARQIARQMAEVGRQQASDGARAAWAKIDRALPSFVGAEVHAAWFAQVAVVDLDGDTLRLAAGTRHAATWIESKLADKVIDAAAAVGIRLRTVSVVHRLQLVVTNGGSTHAA